MRSAVSPLGFPAITIGGLYGGVFSPTEAAAVCVLYALILELVVFRSMSVFDFHATAKSTGPITAGVFIPVGARAAFSWIISFGQTPQAMLAAVGIAVMGRIGVLYVISIAFFIGCMFVNPIVVILVLVPIFAPIVQDVGLDLVLVGTIITLQVAICSATPPFGCGIFTAVAVFKRPYMEVIRGMPPFIVMLLGVSVALIFLPGIALFPARPRLRFLRWRWSATTAQRGPGRARWWRATRSGRFAPSAPTALPDRLRSRDMAAA